MAWPALPDRFGPDRHVAPRRSALRASGHLSQSDDVEHPTANTHVARTRRTYSSHKVVHRRRDERTGIARRVRTRITDDERKRVSNAKQNVTPLLPLGIWILAVGCWMFNPFPAERFLCPRNTLVRAWPAFALISLHLMLPKVRVLLLLHADLSHRRSSSEQIRVSKCVYEYAAILSAPLTRPRSSADTSAPACHDAS